MAAPASKTIGDLNGKWVLNKALSDSVEPALALQGVGWLVRKAIGSATVTLHVKQYKAAPSPIDSSSSTPASAPPAADAPLATHIDIQQTVGAAGLKGTAEHRCLDYEFRDHSDWLFGHVQGRSRFVAAAELRSLVGEGSEAREKKWVDGGDPDFAARDWVEGDAENAGPAGESHILSFVQSLDAAWTALQVWGFQDVGGERRYVRNVVVANGDKYVSFKMVYDWVPE
ncbi:hypothetical protein AAE478_000261 [Parahypoxylon ruwenzoriense]